MTSWRDAEFAVIDLETTGLDPAVHEVLSVGVVPVDGGRICPGRAFYRTVRPLVAPQSRSIVIHGIRPVDAAAAGSADDVGAELVGQLTDRILVAHVADIERAFLARWLDGLGYHPSRVVDTDLLARLVIARKGGPLFENHVGLGAAAAMFGLPEHRRHHALGDALTTAQLFLATATYLSPDHDARVSDLLRAGGLLARERRRRRWAHLRHPLAGAVRRQHPPP